MRYLIAVSEGDRFNRLTIIKEVEKTFYNKTTIRNVLCRCDCGSEKVIPLVNVIKGKTKSCGCLSKENTRNLNLSHGLRHTKLYCVYRSMRNRCQLPSDTNYHKYGARGIKVCDKWQTIEGFLEDMGDTYQEGLSLERIDPNGNYEPSNCRWIPLKDQAFNKRNTVSVLFEGKEIKLTDLVKEYNIGYQRLYRRIFLQGMTSEEAVKDYGSRTKTSN